MSNNPFIFGKHIEKGNFYNRREEVEAAMGLLKKLQSFSVVGERKIGKTSFLRYILSEDVLEAHRVDPESYVVIYLSLGGLHETSKESLISTIVKKIIKQTQIETDSASVFDEFKTCIKCLALNRKNLIIALDEFDVIAPILDNDFSHWLRFIFQEQNVVAITASQKTVRELETSQSIASPLFNIFGNIFLGLFEISEIENMIIDMFQKGGIRLQEEEVTFLANLSGGNPYFAQLVGYHFYEEKMRNRKIIPEKFKEYMLSHANDQFEDYWKHLSKDEKKFLVYAEGHKDDQISSILKRKGFIIFEYGKWKIFSSLFQEFINNKAKMDRDLVFD